MITKHFMIEPTQIGREHYQALARQAVKTLRKRNLQLPDNAEDDFAASLDSLDTHRELRDIIAEILGTRVDLQLKLTNGAEIFIRYHKTGDPWVTFYGPRLYELHNQPYAKPEKTDVITEITQVLGSYFSHNHEALRAAALRHL